MGATFYRGGRSSVGDLKGGALIWSAVLPVIRRSLFRILWLGDRSAWWSWKFPPAVLTTILGFFLILGGIIGAIAPSVARQSRDLVDQGTQGVQTILDWPAGLSLQYPKRTAQPLH